MAALIRDLLKRFPKARILGHRDLPEVRKACPSYDVRADLNAEKPSQDLKNLPRIRDRPMHRVQKPAPDSGHTYARGGRNVTQIQGTFMHGVQKYELDSRLIYAQCAER